MIKLKDILLEKGTRCWKGYTKKGMKTMFGKRVPNCVKRESKLPDEGFFDPDQMIMYKDESIAPNHDGKAAPYGSGYDEIDEDLRNWLKQKWVRIGPDGKIRGSCGGRKKGEGKPKCLPIAKARALGKKKRAAAARRKRREDPNPDRRGKAKNVATKSKRKKS